MLEAFDEYTIDNSDENIVFEGIMDISSLDLSGVQFLSTSADETIKKYQTNLDMENEKFSIITQYIQDGEVVYEESMDTIPYYDEYGDDYYINMPDGTTISVSESITTDNMNQCSVTLAAIGIALTAKEVAVLLTAVTIVAAPVVVQVVKTVVTTIVTWVKSFWSWFRSLFTKKTTTVYTTTVTTAISYSVSLSGTKVEAKPFSKTMNFKPNKFHIAIADTEDGILYVSQAAVDSVSALAILTTATYVTSAHGSGKQFVVSLYTKYGSDAYNMASSAGAILGIPGATYHPATKRGYYNHYHPGAKYDNRLSKPHVFYGSAR